MIDRHELLGTLKPLVGVLEDSIRDRVLATPESQSTSSANITKQS